MLIQSAVRHAVFTADALEAQAIGQVLSGHQLRAVLYLLYTKPKIIQIRMLM